MDIRIIILVVSLLGEFELEKGVIGLFTTHCVNMVLHSMVFGNLKDTLAMDPLYVR